MATSTAPWFGRSDLFGTLERRLEGFLSGFRQNCALLGPASLGKTTLLRRLLQQGSPQGRFIGIYALVEGSEEPEEWARRFVQSLCYGLLQSSKGGERIPNEMEALLRACEPTAPGSVGSARRLLEAGSRSKPEEIFDRLLDLPEQVTKETGLPCVFVLDEFDRLAGLYGKDPFHLLGKKIMVQPNTLYLVASSQLHEARQILRKGLRLLFGQFEVIDIVPLHPSDSLQAIRSVWPKGQLASWMEQLLVEFSQGYPGLLDFLILGLLEKGLGMTFYDQERGFLDLLESLFLGPRGDLRVRYEEDLRLLPAGRRPFAIEVLRLVASGHSKVSEMSASLGAPVRTVQRMARLLAQKGFLLQQGSFYRVREHLFQLWLLAAFPVLGVGWADPIAARAYFRDAAWSWMEDLRRQIQRSPAQRVMDWLARWGGELVEMEGRRLRLPRFSQMEERYQFGGRSSIAAYPVQGKAKRWIVIPWEGALDEERARLIVSQMSDRSFKEDRKLIAGAYPVDLHARLILQQAKIRLWEMDGQAKPLYPTITPVAYTISVRPGDPKREGRTA